MLVSERDRKELERFVKFFVFKCVQVIVQSRRGEPQRTPCKPKGFPSDWFTLNVPEISEITREVRRVLDQSPQKTLTCGSPLCVELSLRTPEDESLLLEIWEIALLADVDSTAKYIHEVYNRMGMLLKSLIAVSRVLPAYRLALSQNPDTYILHYRVYCGSMQDNLFSGDNSNLASIGQVGMAHGTVSLSVRYRTKLVLGSSEKQNNEMLMVKSNHFSSTDAKAGMNSGALEDAASRGIGKPAFDLGTEWPPCGRAQHQDQFTNPKTKQIRCLNASSPFGAFAPPTVPEIGGGFGLSDLAGHRKVPEDLCEMFSTLLLDPDESLPIRVDERDISFSDDEGTEVLNGIDLAQESSVASQKSREPYVYVDLKPAFAEHLSDLGIFFSGAPPPLKSWSVNVDDAGPWAEEARRRFKTGFTDFARDGVGRGIAQQPETLEQQVKQLHADLKDLHEIDRFLQEVCGAEA